MLQKWQDGEPKGSNAFISLVLSWATGGRIWETTPSSYFFCSWWRARAWVDQVDPKWKRPSTAPWPLLVDTLAKWQMAHITPSATSPSVLQAVAAHNHIIHCFLPLEPPNLSASWLHTCARTIYCDLALIVRPKTKTKTKKQLDKHVCTWDIHLMQCKFKIKYEDNYKQTCMRSWDMLHLSSDYQTSQQIQRQLYKDNCKLTCMRPAWDILQLSSDSSYSCRPSSNYFF